MSRSRPLIMKMKNEQICEDLAHMEQGVQIRKTEQVYATSNQHAASEAKQNYQE